MRVLTADEAYESLVLQTGDNRWFMRADLVSWPKRAWTRSAGVGGWTIVANDEGQVWFAVRTVDQLRRATEVSLAAPSLRCHEAAAQYAADYLNAASTICWLPANVLDDDFAILGSNRVTLPNFFSTGAGQVDAIVIEADREDDHAYLSIP
jgi:hypothetical protein